MCMVSILMLGKIKIYVILKKDDNKKYHARLLAVN